MGKSQNRLVCMSIDNIDSNDDVVEYFIDRYNIDWAHFIKIDVGVGTYSVLDTHLTEINRIIGIAYADN